MLKTTFMTFALMTGAPALAEIVFQQSGDNARNLEISGPIYRPVNYRATFDAPGLDPDQFIVFAYGIAATFLYFDGEIIDYNDAPFHVDFEAFRIGTAFVGEFSVPEFVDYRDANGNGYVFQNFYRGAAMGVFVETVGGQPVPWTFTVETLAAVPEPRTWAMMFAGFAIAGATVRRARSGTPAHNS